MIISDSGFLGTQVEFSDALVNNLSNTNLSSKSVTHQTSYGVMFGVSQSWITAVYLEFIDIYTPNPSFVFQYLFLGFRWMLPFFLGLNISSTFGFFFKTKCCTIAFEFSTTVALRIMRATVSATTSPASFHVTEPPYHICEDEMNLVPLGHNQMCHPHKPL